MAREKKAQIIDNLQKTFSRSSIGILTEYRGLPTAELNELRRKLRASKVEYKVVKNTLARLAAKNAGKDNLAGIFQGPVAVALGYGEITDTAKALVDYIRGSKTILKIKGGFLGNRVLTPGEVEVISALPTKDVLISQVMAGIQSPMVTLVSMLAAPLRGIMGVLQARMQQLEGK